MNSALKNSVLFLLALCACQSPKTPDSRNNDRLYLIVGSYSDGTTSGLSVYDFDTQTGDFAYVSDVKDLVNPSYLAVSPDGQRVYSVNETANGAVSSFAFDKLTGTLSRINYQFTESADPCYISIAPDGSFLVTANYSGGNLSVFPLHKDGCIRPLLQNIALHPASESTPSHIHSVVFAPDGQSLWVTDLGRDEIHSLDVQAGTESLLRPDSRRTLHLQAGSGPRHLAFHPNGHLLYCINELSGTVAVLNEEAGRLSVVQYIASDTTAGSGPKGSADIHLSPDGKYLYASNRLKADGIAVFSVDPENGTLTRAGYQETGVHPRNFILTPNGKFLLCANRDSHSIQIFEIDPDTGLLHRSGKEIPVDKPVCLKWIE
ncbi:MAG: lactonase family protein [Dysgonamonadaceae bacterium]|jgi:6-phosphogluconolactonase (cycloisomerase 2 family)|nr:lactonase family protein [Dysgonamonadaceae bacterium]